ncbi:MAG: SGNH/GDSL hydrolase family protein [Acidimicrobiales bacterium]|nr:SGNH/GDSL hydrolase family protein [Acidimicrobiales bacterium]
MGRPAAATDARRRRRRNVIALVALLVVAAGLATWIVIGNIRRGTRVEIVGDSVTALSAKEIEDRIDWTERLKIEAHPGFRTDQLIQFAEPMFGRGDPPPIGVVLTGYNDLLQGEDTSDAVDEMMLLLSGVECGIWLLLPTKGVYSADDAAAFNERAEELADRADVHIETGWRDAVDDSDGAAPNSVLIGEDHVHPNPEGAEKLGEVIEASLREHCGLLAG